MNVIKGNIDELKVFKDQDLDIRNATYIFIQNNGGADAYFGNRKIGAGKEADIPLGLVIEDQIKHIRFDAITATKELYIMLVRASHKCNL